MRLRKDGTPCKKPGRKPDPAKQRGPSTFDRTAPRPSRWVTGPDEFKHDMYHPWQMARAQAKFRGEEWDLSFEEYYNLWRDYWHNRGRKAEHSCMTRKDIEGPWDKNNTHVINRYQHWLNQAAQRKANNMKYNLTGKYRKVKNG